MYVETLTCEEYSPRCSLGWNCLCHWNQCSRAVRSRSQQRLHSRLPYRVSTRKSHRLHRVWCPSFIDYLQEWVSNGNSIVGVRFQFSMDLLSSSQNCLHVWSECVSDLIAIVDDRFQRHDTHCRSGQLGLGDIDSRVWPSNVKALQQQKVTYASCGEKHSAVITLEGGVFSFGSSAYGQLGHNSTNDELLPRKISELMGSEVSQIACGR